MIVKIIRDREEDVRSMIGANNGVCPYTGEKCICEDFLYASQNNVCKAGLYRRWEE